jgi:hypothetical protein
MGLVISFGVWCARGHNLIIAGRNFKGDDGGEMIPRLPVVNAHKLYENGTLFANPLEFPVRIGIVM